MTNDKSQMENGKWKKYEGKMAADKKKNNGAGAPSEDAQRAAEGILGPNPFVGFGFTDLLTTAGRLLTQAAKQPRLVIEQQAAFTRELILALAGKSEIAPEAGDKRFQDPAWQDNPIYRASLQTYLAWRRGLHALIDGAGMDRQDTERARFTVSLLTEALAPTNTLLGNPAALKNAFDTGGASLVRGLLNLLDDIAHNGGMPSQVDKSAFQVGHNLAVTPGAVVFKNDVLEVIQYAPVTAEVYRRPLLFVPPQINKFYIFDLAPGRSLFEYAVKHGIQIFTVSWRNPRPEQRHWNLETYLAALLEASDAVREITGSEEINVMGACAGGITLSALLGHLAAKGDRRVNAVTFTVALLDTSAESQLGLFATEATVALAKRQSQVKGVLEGQDMARVFSWLRPNDLVWNYWVNNYLMGNGPPAFDILYWNNDPTRLPAALHSQFLDFFLANPFKHPGTLKLLGTPIDLSKVDSDAYLIAGMTDHITPWKGCYAATQMLGGKREFVLSSSGHIQSLVNPPGNPKAKFYVNPQLPASPDEWLAEAQPQSGSWWDHWRAWLVERSGESLPAPQTLGNKQHHPGAKAPGTYVFEP